MPSYDILQGVKYDPRYDDQNFALIAQGVEEANKRYNIGEASIGDALAQYGSIPAVNPDRPILAKRLENFNKDIDELVNKKYAGDYGAASKEIARRIKTEQPMFAAAKQRYEMDQKMMPLYTQLESQKKLINKDGIDPRTLSTFDAQGNINMPTYNPLERSDYDKVINEGLVQGIDKLATETGLEKADVYGFLQSAKMKGLAAMPEGELKKRVKEYLPQFLATTTFNDDPEMKGYSDPAQYVIDRATALAGSSVDKQLESDWLARARYAESIRKQRLTEQAQQRPSEVIGDPLGSTAFSTGLGQPAYEKQNIIELGVLDSKGNFTTEIPTVESVIETRKKHGLESGQYATPEAKKAIKDRIDKANSTRVFVNDLVAKMKDNFPKDTEGKTPGQIYDLATSDREKYKISMSNEYPIQHGELTKRIATNLAGSIDNAEVFLRNSTGSTTKNWQGKHGIADEIGSNSAGLGSYIKANNNLIKWDDGEMAYAIIVPKNLKKLTSSGNYDPSGYSGEMTKVYFTTSSKDQHMRNVVKSLENAVKGVYKGEGLNVETNSVGGKVNIVLPKGVIPISPDEPVFDITDASGNPVSNKKYSFSDIKNQYLQSKFVSLQSEADKLDTEGKKIKDSQAGLLDLED